MKYLHITLYTTASNLQHHIECPILCFWQRFCPSWSICLLYNLFVCWFEGRVGRRIDNIDKILNMTKATAVTQNQVCLIPFCIVTQWYLTSSNNSQMLGMAYIFPIHPDIRKTSWGFIQCDTPAIIQDTSSQHVLSWMIRGVATLTAPSILIFILSAVKVNLPRWLSRGLVWFHQQLQTDFGDFML